MAAAAAAAAEAAAALERAAIVATVGEVGGVECTHHAAAAAAAAVAAAGLIGVLVGGLMDGCIEAIASRVLFFDLASALCRLDQTWFACSGCWPSEFARNLQSQSVRKRPPLPNEIGHTHGSASRGAKP